MDAMDVAVELGEGDFVGTLRSYTHRAILRDAYASTTANHSSQGTQYLLTVVLEGLMLEETFLNSQIP